MKIASWNVNSLRVRLPHVLDWITSNNIDVLGLQETKTQDEDFPVDALNEAGYEAVFSGQKTYNGVALLVRRESVIDRFGPVSSVVTDLPDYEDPQRRLMIATLGNMRIANVYIPNGSSPESDKFVYKLNWLRALHSLVKTELETHDNFVLMGDFNIAPADEDVHDPAAWEGQVLVSDEERNAYASLLNLGLTDTFRQFDQEPASFSWWDYRAAGFRRNRGVRIDLLLASKSLLAGLVSSAIDKGPRALERPSDHAPIVAKFTV